MISNESALNHLRIKLICVFYQKILYSFPRCIYAVYNDLMIFSFSLSISIILESK